MHNTRFRSRNAKTTLPEQFICTASGPSVQGSTQKFECVPYVQQSSRTPGRNPGQPFKSQTKSGHLARNTSVPQKIISLFGVDYTKYKKRSNAVVANVRSYPRPIVKNSCSYGSSSRIIYVQGGAPAPPVSTAGSESTPYNSLIAAAADPDWITLIVLFSNAPLDYGINLRPGSKIIGQGRFGCSDSDMFPIITNTTNMNGGHAITAESGNITIKNLRIQSTQKSAINILNLDSSDLDLKIRNVTISDTNTSNSIYDLNNFFVQFSLTSRIPHGAIDIITNGEGSTELKNVTIVDNNTGNGVAEYAFGGIFRKFSLKNSDISGLTNRIADDNMNTISNAPVGVTVLSSGEGTRVKASVMKVDIKDFITTVTPGSTNFVPIGVAFLADNGADMDGLLMKSSVTKIADTNNQLNDTLSCRPFASSNVFGNNFKCEITKCEFEENAPTQFGSLSTLAVHANVFGNSSILDMSENMATTYGQVLEQLDASDSTIFNLRDNEFHDVSRVLSVQHPIVPFGNLKIDFRDNYVDGEGPTLLEIGSDIFPTLTWNSTNFDFNNNCVISNNALKETFFVGTTIADPVPIETIVIKGSNNNFLGYDVHLLNSGLPAPNLKFMMPNNYWEGLPVINDEGDSLIQTNPEKQSLIPGICN